MGFCLLEHATTPGSYFAVNPQHVDGIALQKSADGKEGWRCLLSFTVDVAPFYPLAVGTEEQIQKAMMDALKIPLLKVDLNILAGQESQSKMPLLLNKPERIVIVREMMSEEFSGPESVSTTASQMFFVEGMSRSITERPGIFVKLANDGGVVPMVVGRAL